MELGEIVPVSNGGLSNNPKRVEVSQMMINLVFVIVQKCEQLMNLGLDGGQFANLKTCEIHFLEQHVSIVTWFEGTLNSQSVLFEISDGCELLTGLFERIVLLLVKGLSEVDVAAAQDLMHFLALERFSKVGELGVYHLVSFLVLAPSVQTMQDLVSKDVGELLIQEVVDHVVSLFAVVVKLLQEILALFAQTGTHHVQDKGSAHLEHILDQLFTVLFSQELINQIKLASLALLRISQLAESLCHLKLLGFSEV